MWFYLATPVWQTGDVASEKWLSYFTSSLPCLIGEIIDSLGHCKIEYWLIKYKIVWSLECF